MLTIILCGLFLSVGLAAVACCVLAGRCRNEAERAQADAVGYAQAREDLRRLEAE
jgi:uncharacterized membrane protein YuzA (DUF378 family)